MQTLQKYQILEKIGVGGFGVVYKATDPFIKRFVAIKTCTSADPETRDRFLREAEIAGNLHHRNIVTVYDFGFHEETPYLVQEYLTGEDLDRKIKRREFLPLPAKVLYLVQIARGLQYAHSKGVTHRDIKPANIRILEDDTAKIMDFGIAKLAQQQQSLTQAGITLGTAAYLAPEQIKGEPSGPRTDIFSFGALSYELVAGERPFGGAEISAIFYRILHEEAAPLRSLAADCPPELERIIHRCLEKNPAKRYPSCDPLVHDLEELGRRRGHIPPATGSRTVLTPASVVAPVAAASDPRESARTRSLQLGDVELDATRPPGPPVESEGLNTVSFRRKSPARAKAGLALAAVVLAAIGGWAIWRFQDSVLAAGSASRHAVSSPAPAAPPTILATPPAVTPPPAQDPATGVEPPLAQPTAAPETSAEVAPPAEPEPEPVRPATLIVAPAWESTMTVRVGRKSWPLDRERRFELEPGTYKVRFSLQTPVFAQEKESSVRLGEGETRRLVTPIERPGRLTVQPHLNTRQGFVRIDGAAAGPTPLRGRWLAPGPHVVEIAAGPEPGSPSALRETVEVASDQETIFTFDLEGRIERRLSSRPALPN